MIKEFELSRCCIELDIFSEKEKINKDKLNKKTEKNATNLAPNLSNNLPALVTKKALIKVPIIYALLN